MTRIGFVEPIDPRPLDRSARRYGTPSKSDQRSAGQRDRDRILYASAFRRLGGVTQVVLAIEEGHVFHNRLTHSLKVSQIARRLAEKILHDTEGDAKAKAHIADLGGLDPDVVEAAGLAHDLGHPPFGHIGEQELDRLACQWNRDGFEGNAQSFRIVTRLALTHRADEWPGLNLSRATLGALLKYPWLRPKSDEHPPKFGAYVQDRRDYRFARTRVERGGLPRDGQTLEAQIMDWADDITYAVHDAEDFFRAGWIPMDRLQRSIVPDASKVPSFSVTPEMRSIFDDVQKRWKGASPNDQDLFEASTAIREFPIDRAFEGTRDHRYYLRSWSSALIGDFVLNTTFRKGVLSKEPRVEREVALLKQLTWRFVISNPILSTHQHGQREVIRQLFLLYFRELRRGNTSVFPLRVRNEAALPTNNQERARFVVDVIASMSEVAVLHTHQRLTGINLGPLEDPAAIWGA
jgi:dGTPase